MEFKKLSAVEMVDTVDQDTTVLIEKDGVIKRAPKNEIGNRVKKELVYEWNFSADDDVYDILEHVDDDISWLVEKNDAIGWEIEFVTYATYEVFDPDADDWFTFIEDALTTTVYANDTNYYIGYNSNGHMSCQAYSEGPQDFYNGQAKDYYSTYPCAEVYNKVYIDEEGVVSETDIGGTIVIFQDEKGPFKSVKIYKITH